MPLPVVFLPSTVVTSRILSITLNLLVFNWAYRNNSKSNVPERLIFSPQHWDSNFQTAFRFDIISLSTRKSGYNTYRGWTQTGYLNKRYNINQKDEGT